MPLLLNILLFYMLYSVQSTYHLLFSHPNKNLETYQHYLYISSTWHLIFIFTLIAFILCLDDCTRLLIRHGDSRLVFFKSDLCYTMLYHHHFYWKKKQIWPVHFYVKNYPVVAIAESKQLIMISKTLPLQALAVCTAPVLPLCPVLTQQTASIPQAFWLSCIHAQAWLCRDEIFLLFSWLNSTTPSFCFYSMLQILPTSLILKKFVNSFCLYDRW